MVALQSGTSLAVGPAVGADCDAWGCVCTGRGRSDARKLSGLEDEDTRLKKLLAESVPEVSTLRVLAGERRRLGYRRLQILLARQVL